MKKLAIFLLVSVFLITLSACEKEIELTPDNITEYLSFTKEYSGGDVENNSSLPDYLGGCYVGEGTYTLKTARTANANFENVKVRVKLILNGGTLPDNETWQFKSGGNKYFIPSSGSETGGYEKIVEMNISYEGNGSVSENVCLDKVWKYSWPPASLDHGVCSFEIVSVTGNVIVHK